MQTLNGALKNKLIQSEKTGTAGKGKSEWEWNTSHLINSTISGYQIKK